MLGLRIWIHELPFPPTLLEPFFPKWQGSQGDPFCRAPRSEKRLLSERGGNGNSQKSKYFFGCFRSLGGQQVAAFCFFLRPNRSTLRPGACAEKAGQGGRAEIRRAKPARKLVVPLLLPMGSLLTIPQAQRRPNWRPLHAQRDFSENLSTPKSISFCPIAGGISPRSCQIPRNAPFPNCKYHLLQETALRRRPRHHLCRRQIPNPRQRLGARKPFFETSPQPRGVRQPGMLTLGEFGSNAARLRKRRTGGIQDFPKSPPAHKGPQRASRNRASAP